MQNKTDIEIIELLVSHGELTISKKSGDYMATLIQKDGYGVFTDPISEWGKDLQDVLLMLSKRIE